LFNLGCPGGLIGELCNYNYTNHLKNTSLTSKASIDSYYNTVNLSVLGNNNWLFGAYSVGNDALIEYIVTN